jgi:bifunctional DNA-binding transcriptional regulator/antitoxin component of YhaV-PrlF toxin-antitoxin module
MGTRFILQTDKRGRMTLPKELLEHLGIPFGGKIEVEFHPEQICIFRAVRVDAEAKALNLLPSARSE